MRIERIKPILVLFSAIFSQMTFAQNDTVKENTLDPMVVEQMSQKFGNTRSTGMRRLALEAGVEMFNFFDNTEFGGCKYQNDQTMPGTVLTPELGLRIDVRHNVRIGASVVAAWGDEDIIRSVSPIAYYEYNAFPLKFMVGFFPRSGAQMEMPRVMMQDSVSFYRNVMNGFKIQAGGDRTYVNLWLDWTGLQTKKRRESFFVGWDGKWTKSVFVAKHDGYMFHYAKMKDAPEDQYIHDNVMLTTQAGVDFAELPIGHGFNELSLMAGWVCGLEDNRGETGWLNHNAFMLDFTLDWKRLGVKNSLYIGDGQMDFYKTESNKMYWGDPSYRANFYNRTDLYAHILNYSFIDIFVDFAFHAFKSGVYVEQCLTARVDLNNYGRKVKTKKYRPAFADWFSKIRRR